MRKVRGFTLLELLVTISIIAILGGLALPAFNGVIEGSRLTSSTNAIVGALNLARSEAIKRKLPIEVKKISDNQFQVVDANAEVIKDIQISDKGITVNSSAGGSIKYQANGYRELNSSEANIKLCSESDCRTIVISTGGSVNVEH